jgi:hypothetical protein
VLRGELVHIGKETNRLEAVEQGLVHDWADVQLILREPSADFWTTDVLPRLQKVVRGHLSRSLGCSERTLTEILAGRRRPRIALRTQLMRCAKAQSWPVQGDDSAAPICPVCTVGISKQRAVFCSQACRQRAYRRRVRER